MRFPDGRSSLTPRPRAHPPEAIFHPLSLEDLRVVVWSEGDILLDLQGALLLWIAGDSKGRVATQGPDRPKGGRPKGGGSLGEKLIP